MRDRLDCVPFVLDKKYLVKRGKNVDLASLLRNVPARVTPEKEVREVTWSDVTQELPPRA